MIKQSFCWILLLIFTSANAAEVDSMFVGGAAYKLIHISNDHNSGYLYAENYQHQKIFIYKSNFPYQPDSTFGSDQLEGTDVLDIMFQCNKDMCTRYLNRRTSALSNIYKNVLDYNGKKDVIAYYLKDKNLVIISRAFKACKKPLTYPIKLEENSDFGIKTKFLTTGGLQLDYEIEGGKDIIKIINPNYKKLFSNCGGATE